MSEDYEMLLKRVELLEKGTKINFANFQKHLDRIARNHYHNTYKYITREINNEADICLLKEYLAQTGLIDYRDFINFKKNHDLMQTYRDENANSLKMLNHLGGIDYTPEKEMQIANYVNNSNALIGKKRFQIKKQLLLDKGYDINSEEVAQMDRFIDSFNTEISENNAKKITSIKDQEYYVKKDRAEEMYNDFFINNNNDSAIIERIREIPLLEYIPLEPSSKILYDEVIRNYWIGNFNASIVLLSIFLEAYLKEKYYSKTKISSDETLAPLINKCASDEVKILNTIQKGYLLDFADRVRNNYIHVRYHKLVTDVTMPVVKIDFNNPSKTEATYGTSDALPVLIDFGKMNKDRVDSKKLIIDIAKIVKDISKSNDVNDSKDKKKD